MSKMREKQGLLSVRACHIQKKLCKNLFQYTAKRHFAQGLYPRRP